jgi:hypothetical protein
MVIQLLAPASEVFPLFTPVDEKLWAAEWDPQLVHPASGEAQEGMVFTTTHAGEPTSIWTIVLFDKGNSRISYVKVTPEKLVTKIDIRCQENPDGSTGAEVTYTHTALSPHGNDFIEGFTEAKYRDQINGWEQAINHTLKHGQAPIHHETTGHRSPTNQPGSLD